ncbi:MAG: hypothetical protein ACR2H4_07665 [Pyrinomonadaceae bacterium]
MKRTISVVTLAIVAIGLTSFISLPISRSAQTDQLPKSRLGIIGQIGLVIRRVDPSSSVELAGLKVGDVVIGTSLGGDITSIAQFQKEITALEPGTKVQITYLRFNATTATFDELKTTVTTIPFPSQARGLATGKLSNAFAQAGCTWCCQYCEGFEPYNQSCAVGTRFTGRIDCSIINGRCRFYYCV